ncbi:uncharacterized protein LOC133202792 [Saccostrea echinata]|uniref:uncharacterized protein LOC133202792 n=1 Tax=Saccostrea echinata TaxID=191078 RepID=UPI002A8034A8|nr:uncharacterized protein LOC133202792 [Saccostrea echinata]
MCRLYCLFFVSFALFLTEGANASALARSVTVTVDPCVNYCQNGGVCSLISNLHCECSWEYLGDRCQEEVFVLRHNFADKKELTLTGDLKDWPELGPDGEAFIGRINRNQEFWLSTTHVETTGTDVCVSFTYRMEEEGCILSLFFQKPNFYHPILKIEKPQNGYRKWSVLRYDMSNQTLPKDLRFAIYGSTKSSNGSLYIDDVIIAERKCAEVFGA